MSKSGFTLLELLVVVALTATLAGAAIPAVLTAIPAINLKTAANGFAGDLKLTRSYAIKRQETTGLFFDISDRSYKIVANGPDGLAGTPDDTMLKKVMLSNFKGGVHYGSGPARSQARETGGPFADNFSGITCQYPRLFYTKNGMNGGGMGYVYLSNRYKQICYAIGINSTAGVVVMKKTSGNIWKKL